MPTDAIPWWIAIGVLLVLGYLAVYGVGLCHRALRNNGEVEIEVKSSIASIRLCARGGKPIAGNPGEGYRLAQQADAATESVEDLRAANDK